MSWLDNGTIRVGIDLALGGAITWISRSGDDANVINSHDWGRQVQMSYYSGPVPFVVGDKRPRKFWEGLGWNPIQAGDDFGHGSRILEHTNDGHKLYVKCTPMQWPLDNVPGDCTFESWLELSGSSVEARCRLSNTREDKTWYPARSQELPAVYTNGWLHQIVSYTGDKPFTGGELTTVPPKGPVEGWTRWWATEGWSALISDDGWGLGVVNPDCIRHIGGFNGQPGSHDPKNSSCGYIAPTRLEILDHDIIHEYRYELILGTLEEIRRHAYEHVPHPGPPVWNFERDRQGWYYHGAKDQGWPISGELQVRSDDSDPRLNSPQFICPAEEAPALVINAAFETRDTRAQVFWSTIENPNFTEPRSVWFPIQGDGQFREYRVRLADSSEYKGLLLQLQLHPANEVGAKVRVRSVRLERDSAPTPN